MFRDNDKLSLTLMNAKDINGKIIPFLLQLPLNQDYSLPIELASIDVFEYHEGLVNGGTVAFSIYIGEVTTMNNLIAEIDVNNIKVAENIKITSVDSNVCVQSISGKQIVFATVNKQDIVVKNLEQLIAVISQLSDRFKSINDSTIKIRTLSNQKYN